MKLFVFTLDYQKWTGLAGSPSLYRAKDDIKDVKNSYSVLIRLSGPVPSPSPTPTPVPTPVPTPKTKADFLLEDGYPSVLVPRGSQIAVGSAYIAEGQYTDGSVLRQINLPTADGEQNYAVILPSGDTALTYTLYAVKPGDYKTVWKAEPSTGKMERVIVQEKLKGGLLKRGSLQIFQDTGGGLVLPVSVTQIADDAFADVGMRKAVIPASCSWIGSRAFADNPGLIALYLPADVTFPENTFDNDALLVLYAPPGGQTEKLAHKYGIPFISME